MNINTKRIIVTAIPIILVLLAFIVVDSVLVRKHTSAHRESLLVAAKGFRGLLVSQRVLISEQLYEVVSKSLNNNDFDHIENVLLDAGFGDISAWVLSNSDGSIIISSDTDSPINFGRENDNLFNSHTQNNISTDFVIFNHKLFIKAYGTIKYDSSDLILGVLVPTSTIFKSKEFNNVDNKSNLVFYSPLGGIIIGSNFLGSNSDILIDLHSSLSKSKTPEVNIADIGGDKFYIAAAPLLDFEQWDAHGLVIAFLAESTIMKSIFNKRLVIAGIGFVILLITIFAMVKLFRVISANPPSFTNDPIIKRGIRNQVMMTIIGILIPVTLSMGSVLFFSSNISNHTMANTFDTLEIVGEQVAQLTSQVQLSNPDKLKIRLREIKKSTGIDFTVINSDGKRTSTLREERVDFDPSFFKLSNRKDNLQFGILQINYINYRTVIISDFDIKIFVTLEDSIYQNLLITNNIILLTTFVLTVLIIVVSILVLTALHRERTFRIALAGVLFITPALIILLWWSIGPLLFSLFMTFHRWSVIDPAKPFIGLSNYIRLLGDRLWWRAMLNTSYYVLHIPVAMAVSLSVAMAMNRDIKGISVFRTIFYLPTVNSLVVTALMWRLMFNPEFGMLNYLLSKLGIPGLSWLSHPSTAMPSIMMVTVWFSIGGQMILFLAGLKNIPKMYYEVAAIDGSNLLQKFWFITLPLLRPTLLFVLITSTIGSFQVFTQVYMLTEGGPAGSTDVAMYRIYTEAWYNLRMGYAATQAWMLCLVIFIFTLFQFRHFNRELKY